MEHDESVEGCRFRGGEGAFIRHPEPSLFEGVRISSDTTPVILSGAFPREDLIRHHTRHPERCFPA